MKKMLSLLILVFSLSLAAQNNTPITGFWGLEFGESKAKVKTKLKQKIADESETVILIKSITFGGDSYDSCVMEFFKNKLYLGGFSKHIQSKDEAINFVNNLDKKISSKYGTPDTRDGSIYKLFKWADINDNKILITIDDDELTGYTVWLFYTEESLYIEKQQSELDDF